MNLKLIILGRTALVMAAALIGIANVGSTVIAQDASTDAADASAADEDAFTLGSDAEPASILGEDNADRQPRVVDGHLILPPLAAPTIDTTDVGNGRTPEGYRGGEEAPTQLLAENPQERGESWNWTIAEWAAANTFSNPRYFEDRMLERHGQERCPRLQPLASGARFFATVPMLPYLTVVREPCDCESTLGYYRSGSCAPVMLQRPPYERRAAIVEAAAIAGAIIAFP